MAASTRKPTIRQCPQCYCVHKPQLRTCPECGYEYPVQQREITHEDGELVELDPRAMRRQKAFEQINADSVEKLIELGKRRKYKNPAKWAAHVWTARQRKLGRVR